MVQRLAGDADGEIAHVGEIGQSEPAWLVLLPEDHVALRAVHRAPCADAALQSFDGRQYEGQDAGAASPRKWQRHAGPARR
jgi:hypothetical protein